jgi:hypothetical protein
MRRVFLLALLALALPVAASASSIDYANGGFISLGTASVTGTATAGSTITIGSSLTQINFRICYWLGYRNNGYIDGHCHSGSFQFHWGQHRHYRWQQRHIVLRNVHFRDRNRPRQWGICGECHGGKRNCVYDSA